jgi:hypothetical protein
MTRVKEFLWPLPHATIRLQAAGRRCAAGPSLLYPLSALYSEGISFSGITVLLFEKFSLVTN